MGNENTKRKLPSLVRWILWALLIQFMLINISAAFYAYRLTHFYTDPSLRIYQPSTNIFTKTWKLFTGPKQPRSVITETPGFPFDTVTLKTAEGISIDAWFSKTDSIPKGTVILFHGITANKSVMINEAYEFRYWGYNVMLVDFRGHGNSGGNTTTIGFRESEEVDLAYNYIKQKGEKNILLWGSSMGAVVVAKAIADYDLHPSGAILEMPFQSMQTHLKARARLLGFPQQPFSFLTALWISVERGFNGFNHETTNYAKKITCPVLMEWGMYDIYVMKDETVKIYNAIASRDKKLVIYDQAGHESLLQRDPKKWREKVESFLASSKK
jgi:alpha-beta hydrolase superfamily lysophospholipase